jgi:NADH:ubiquinone oxidoreductase subunit H
MIFPIIDILAVLIPILLAVAYVTLLERKLLGSMQRRVGPDTVGVYGLAQPSMWVVVNKSNKYFYLLNRAICWNSFNIH